MSSFVNDALDDPRFPDLKDPEVLADIVSSSYGKGNLCGTGFCKHAVEGACQEINPNGYCDSFDPTHTDTISAERAIEIVHQKPLKERIVQGQKAA